jgi:hypothetical protein
MGQVSHVGHAGDIMLRIVFWFPECCVSQRWFIRRQVVQRIVEIRNMLDSKALSTMLRMIAAPLLAGLILVSTSAVAGNDPVRPPDVDTGKWKVYGQIYLWGADIGGETKVGDIDVPFDKILDNLEMAFMGTLAARRDKWMVFGDFIYLNVGATKTRNLIDADLDLKTFVTTAGGGYRLARGERSAFNLIAAARYLKLETDVTLIPAEPGNTQSQSVSESNIDAVIGFRGVVDLSDRWYLNYYADLGAGESDFTWQALAAINFRFSPLDVTLGYRYLEWEFDSGTPVEDLNISGPYAGVKWRF